MSVTSTVFPLKQSPCFGFNTQKLPYHFQGLPGCDKGLRLVLHLLAQCVSLSESPLRLMRFQWLHRYAAISVTQTPLHLSCSWRDFHWVKKIYFCCHKMNHKPFFFFKPGYLDVLKIAALPHVHSSIGDM